MGFSSCQLLAVLPVVATGCFFTDPVNTAPTARIQIDDPGPIYLGTTVRLAAAVADPDDRDGTAPYQLTWRVEPHGIVMPEASLTREFAPTFRTREHVLVHLEVRDLEGAVGVASLELWPQDRAPRVDGVTVSGVQNHAGLWVVGTPVTVEARLADEDGDAVSHRFLAYPPGASEPSPSDETAWSDTAPARFSFVPDVEGAWRIVVKVGDGELSGDDFVQTVGVDRDRPPCIEAVSPAVGDDARTPVVFAAADRVLRLRVDSVSDELDSYPPVEPTGGRARFRWFVSDPLDPDALRPIVGHDLPDLDLAAAAYQVGDLVRVRAEVADRNGWPSCAPVATTCACGWADKSSRVTWRVVIR